MSESVHEELAPLPLDESNFSVLRDTGEVYVDKTRMIYELARHRSKTLLVRPRRFGKSLIVSTLYSLFKYGLRDFSGLAIENLWRDDKKYSVVSLDFSKIKAFNKGEGFKKNFSDYLLNCQQINGLVKDNFPPNARGMREFSKWLAKQPNNSVVLLIDEYDWPLTSCLNDPNLFHQVSRVLDTFYSCVKGDSGVFRFLFLTGVTKVGNAEMCAGLNNLDDISLVPDYGEIAGFSLEELKHYFGDYLKIFSKALNLSESQLIEELIANYGGLSFEETATKKVFAPWSLLNFFKTPKRGFANYWVDESSQPSVLLKYLKENALVEPSKYSEKKSIYRSELSGYVKLLVETLKLRTLQTGHPEGLPASPGNAAMQKRRIRKKHPLLLTGRSFRNTSRNFFNKEAGAP